MHEQSWQPLLINFCGYCVIICKRFELKLSHIDSETTRSLRKQKYLLSSFYPRKRVNILESVSICGLEYVIQVDSAKCIRGYGTGDAWWSYEIYAGVKRRKSNSKYTRERERMREGAYITEQSLIALKLVITEICKLSKSLALSLEIKLYFAQRKFILDVFSAFAWHFL